jgi:hypothetical protein
MAEPTLYAQRIDSQGLSLEEPLELAHAASWPAAVSANDGTIDLFWLNSATQTPRYARLLRGQTSRIEALDRAFTLESGDRLQSLDAALDTTHVYLLWNITRRSGENESGMIARAIGATTWGEGTRLGIGEVGTLNIETGFNSGRVHHVQAGEQWLRWAAPLPGQFEMLPVAAVLDAELIIGYFQSGRLLAYQEIAPVRGLLRPPVLRTDRDRYLYLAWAEPGESGAADLKLTSTRPLP